MGTVRTFETPDGTVTIESFAEIVRYHPCGGYGSPFTFVCTLTVSGTEARAFGALGRRGTMTAKVRRAIAAALQAAGIELVTYERRSGGRKRERTAQR